MAPASAKRYAHARLLGGDKHNTLTTAPGTVSTSPVVPAIAAVHAQAHLLHGTSVHGGRASNAYRCYKIWVTGAKQPLGLYIDTTIVVVLRNVILTLADYIRGNAAVRGGVVRLEAILQDPEVLTSLGTVTPIHAQSSELALCYREIFIKV